MSRVCFSSHGIVKEPCEYCSNYFAIKREVFIFLEGREQAWVLGQLLYSVDCVPLKLNIFFRNEADFIEDQLDVFKLLDYLLCFDEAALFTI